MNLVSREIRIPSNSCASALLKYMPRYEAGSARPSVCHHFVDRLHKRHLPRCLLVTVQAKWEQDIIT